MTKWKMIEIDFRSFTAVMANSKCNVCPSSGVSSLPDLIGNTPLLRLNHLNPNPKFEIYAKAEWANPGSVKDRPALKMIQEAERSQDS